MSDPSRASWLLPVSGALFLIIHPAAATAGPRAPKAAPRLVLFSPDRGGERTVEAADLTFAFYERVYYHKRAPRSQDPTGQRVEVQDRRRECRCLRLDDWSKIPFRKMRQIEIRYPPGEREARLRITRVDGTTTEIPASALFGTEGPLFPRFAATVDGRYREFPLLLGRSGAARWPEETLVRILLAWASAHRRSPARSR